MVTGANRGIGAATAFGLASVGARVLIICRNASSGERIVRKINERSFPGSAELLVADLSNQRVVRKLAADIANLVDRVDVLINNAAIVTHRRTVTVDGFELQFAVNHLAPFLLTNLLLPCMPSGARVITVSSEAHRETNLDFDDLQSERGYTGFQAYCRTKLANILFTRELAKRIRAKSVTAHTVHPGVIATKLLGDVLRLPRFLHGMLRLPFASPRYGARTTIYVASSPSVAGLTGCYFRRCAAVSPSLAARDDDAARLLWEKSREMTELVETVSS